MLNPRQTAFLELHVAVVFFGFTAILGRLIQMSELEIVWYRLLLTVASLVFWPGTLRTLRSLPRGLLLKLAGVGLIVSLHWLCFYGSIKAANVTVALSTFAITSFFTAFIEPFVFRTRHRWSEILIGIIVVPAMYLIFSFGQTYVTGILLGLAAALLAAVFSTLNRKLIRQVGAIPMTVVELGSGWLFLTLLLPLLLPYYPEASLLPSQADWLYLLILALVCTSLAYVLANRSLRQLSAFTATLTVNLEPVYGIILAYFIFHENRELDPNFYIGTAIILLSVFLHPWLEKKLSLQRV